VVIELIGAHYYTPAGLDARRAAVLRLPIAWSTERKWRCLRGGSAW